MHRSRFMRRSSIFPAIVNRIKRDLIHNPLHLLFSVDVLSMTRSTLASLSRGFAELSTDGQFLQLRTKQVNSSLPLPLHSSLHPSSLSSLYTAFGYVGSVKENHRCWWWYSSRNWSSSTRRSFRSFWSSQETCWKCKRARCPWTSSWTWSGFSRICCSTIKWSAGLFLVNCRWHRCQLHEMLRNIE